MGQPYIGEIRLFAGNFAPSGWMFCNGQAIQISEFDTLYNLIGTTYGGDGESTFCVPNLQGRIPVGMGTAPFGTYTLGEVGGVEEVTLITQQIPVHSHQLNGTANPATQTGPGGNLFGVSAQVEYAVAGLAAESAMSPSAITPAGGSQPHTNLQPYLCLNYIISLFGIYPTPA